MKFKLIALLYFLFNFSPLNAQGLPWEGYAYLGLGVSHVELDSDHRFIVSDTESWELEFDNEFAYSLIWGSRFHKHWAIELAYINFGWHENKEIPEISLPAEIVSIEGDSLGANVNFIYPIQSFEVYALLGAHSWQQDGKDGIPGDDKIGEGIDLYYGVGANFHIGKHFMLSGKLSQHQFNSSVLIRSRLDIEEFVPADFKTNMATLSFNLKFY